MTQEQVQPVTRQRHAGQLKKLVIGAHQGKLPKAHTTKRLANKMPAQPVGNIFRGIKRNGHEQLRQQNMPGV
jgi:hypothetical protein